jgi:hypothetical protein
MSTTARCLQSYADALCVEMDDEKHVLPLRSIQKTDHRVRVRIRYNDKTVDTTLSRLATRYSWGEGSLRVTTRWWITIFAECPQNIEQARDWSEREMLWFVAEGDRFMTPCTLEMDLDEEEPPLEEPPDREDDRGRSRGVTLDLFGGKQGPGYPSTKNTPYSARKGLSQADLQPLEPLPGKSVDDLWDFC